MGYYVRILTPSTRPTPLSAVARALRKTPAAVLKRHRKRGEVDAFIGLEPLPGDRPVLSLERTPVSPGSLGEEELAEFDAELEHALPASGAAWVRGYLKTVRTVYAIQFHSHASSAPEIVNAVIEAMRNAAGGIVQADGQGFSNEAGDCVVWQFSDHATGPWTMAVLDDAGEWHTFKMELGRPAHRKAFLAGKAVPRRPATQEKPKPARRTSKR